MAILKIIKGNRVTQNSILESRFFCKINLLLVFLCWTFLFFQRNEAKAQNHEFIVKDFHIDEIKYMRTRSQLLAKYNYSKQAYSAINLSPELRKNISQTIFSTFNGWDELRIIPAMNKKNIWINHGVYIQLDDEEINDQHVKIVREENPLRFSNQVINDMSLILTGGDTLVFIPIEIQYYNGITGKTESLKQLYYQKLDVIRSLCDLRNKVVQLEKHISILDKKRLQLTPQEIKQFNQNMQSRVIDSLKAFIDNSPKVYFVVTNKIASSFNNAFFKPSASGYLVLEYGKDKFVSNNEIHQSLPLMKPELNNQIMIDSVELTFAMEDMIEKIKSIDYHEYFNKTYENFDYATQQSTRDFPNIRYQKAIGYPEFSPLDTLFHTKKIWSEQVSDFIKQEEQRPKKMSFDPFFQKYVSNTLEPESTVINLPKTKNNDYPTWYSIVQEINYSNDHFSVRIGMGSPSEDGNYSYSYTRPEFGSGIWAFEQKKLYDYYTSYMDFYLGESKKIETLINQKERSESEREESLHREMNEKYGKKYVDAMLELKIIVGMHEDILKVITDKLYYVEHTHSLNKRNYYRLDPKYGTGWVSVCIEDKKVASVTYH